MLLNENMYASLDVHVFSLIFQVLSKADIAHICYKMCFVPAWPITCMV